MSKSVAFFLIRSRKKEVKTLSKQSTLFDTPTLIKHSNVSIAQENIRFQMLFWFAAKHLPFLMFNKHMSQKQRQPLLNFILVCSKV